MLLQRYLHTIESINPNKIYVENVRSFFKVPTYVAKLMCEIAVSDRLFTKKIGIVCPNSDCKRIILTFNSYKEIPSEISCSICEADDNLTSTFLTEKLEKVEFYQLNKSK